MSDRDKHHHQAQGSYAAPLSLHGFQLRLTVILANRLQTRQSWSEVFILAAVIHYIGVVFYGIFASGELQPWAEPKVEEDQQMDEVSVYRERTTSRIGLRMGCAHGDRRETVYHIVNYALRGR